MVHRLEEFKVEFLSPDTKRVTLLGPFSSMFQRRSDYSPHEDYHRFQLTFLVKSTEEKNRQEQLCPTFKIDIRLKYIQLHYKADLLF